MAFKTLVGAIGGEFKYIQHTPDLVPADLIDTRIYNQKTGEFNTSLGPVFTNVPPPYEQINVREDDFSKMHSAPWWEHLFRESGLLQVETCYERTGDAAPIAQLSENNWALNRRQRADQGP